MKLFHNGRLLPVMLGGLMLLLALPGCIVQEIRDDLKGVNARLGVVEQSLSDTNAKLAMANEQLTGVGGGLGTTNSSLSTLEQQLTLLESIDKSMVKLDGHLASLRGTIARIDNTIPFLDLGGDAPAPEVAPAAPALEPAGDAQASPADVPAASTPGAGSSAPRDAWVGAWVSADPRRTWTLVLMADGTFVREESTTQTVAGGTTESSVSTSGSWTRDGTGATLTLVLTPAAQPAEQATQQPASQAMRMRVLHQTSRVLALEARGGVLVLRKP